MFETFAANSSIQYADAFCNSLNFVFELQNAGNFILMKNCQVKIRTILNLQCNYGWKISYHPNCLSNTM